MQGVLMIALAVLALCIQDTLAIGDVRCFQCQYIKMKRGSQPEVSKRCLEPDESDARLSRTCHGLCLKTYLSNVDMEYIERACVPKCRDGSRRMTDYGEGVDYCCEGSYCNHSNVVTPSILTIVITTCCVMIARRVL